MRVRVCYHKHFITFCVQSLISVCAGAAKTTSLKLLLNSLLFFFTGCTAFFLSFLSPNPYACFSGSSVLFSPAVPRGCVQSRQLNFFQAAINTISTGESQAKWELSSFFPSRIGWIHLARWRMLTEARNKVLKAPLGIDPRASVIFYKTTRCFLLVSQEPNPPNPEDAVAAPGPVSVARV